MDAKAVARFVVEVLCTVVKHPLGVLASAGNMDEKSGLIVLAVAEAVHAAVFPMLAPQSGVDTTLSVKGGDKLVSEAARADRKLP